MRIGQLDQRVTILAPTVTRGSSGGHTVTFESLLTDGTVWAQVLPDGAGEVREGEKPAGRAQFIVRIRHRDDVAPKYRLQWGSRTLEIVGVPRLHARDRVLEMTCIEAID